MKSWQPLRSAMPPPEGSKRPKTFFKRSRRKFHPSGNQCRSIGLAYAALGNLDAAFLWLERAYERKAESLSLLKVDPKLDPLRTDPRFASLLTRTGLKP